jgi:microcystin-dependent protein
MSDGTPLPSALTGNVKERVIRMDDALFYLVGGALAYLADREPLESTGTLTVDDARLALSAMLEIFYDERVQTMPIGTITMWPDDVFPERWLLLNGAGISKTTYPELFDIYGYTFGGGGDTFVLPTMASKSPMGVGGYINLGETKGNAQVNLTTAQLPSHSHTITDPGHTHPPLAPATLFIGSHAGGTAGVPATAANTRDQIATTGSATTGISGTNATGSGNAVDIVHPVMGVNFIIYAGH